MLCGAIQDAGNLSESDVPELILFSFRLSRGSDVTSPFLNMMGHSDVSYIVVTGRLAGRRAWLSIGEVSQPVVLYLY